MEWFRHYHGLCKDEKLTAAAMSAGVSHCTAVAAWCYVLEHASSARRRGDVTECHARHCAIALRIEVAEADAILAAFAAEGMIAGGKVAKWEKRQFASDSSAERTRKWRENKALEPGPAAPDPSAKPRRTSRKNGVTSCDVTGTSRDAPEQNRTDSSVANATAQPDLKKLVFDRGVALLTAKGASEETARTFFGKAIANTSVGDTLEAIGRAEREDPMDPKSFIRGCLKSKIRRPEQPVDQKRTPQTMAAEAQRKRAAEAQCRAEGENPMTAAGMSRVAEILREQARAA